MALITIVGRPAEDKVCPRGLSFPGPLYFMRNLLAQGARLCVLREGHAEAADEAGGLVSADSP